MRKRQWIPGVIGIAVLLIIILLTIFAPMLAPYSPTATDLRVSLLPPSREHIFGTDVLGRDLFSRVLYGGRSSMLLALLAAVLSMGIGMIVGVCAGYFGGACDHIVTVITNIFQGLPGISMMVAIAGILGPSFRSLMLGLVLTNWTGFSRIIRSEVLKYREESFVEGLRSLGASNGRIIFFHILPNMLGNTVILLAQRVGTSLLSISSLSFLGLGIQPPTPDWSVMLSDAKTYFRSAPHLLIFPGLAILLVLFSIQLIGDFLRDCMDRRGREGSEL